MDEDSNRLDRLGNFGHAETEPSAEAAGQREVAAQLRALSNGLGSSSASVSELTQVAAQPFSTIAGL